MRMLRGQQGRRPTERTVEEAPRTLERDLLRAHLLAEVAPVLQRWGIEGPDCYRRDRVTFGQVLADAVTDHIGRLYLLAVDIREGDTLGEAIDRAADTILEARRHTA